MPVTVAPVSGSTLVKRVCVCAAQELAHLMRSIGFDVLLDELPYCFKVASGTGELKVIDVNDKH